MRNCREKIFAWPCLADFEVSCPFRDSQAPIVDLFYAGDELLAAHDPVLGHLLLRHVFCLHACVEAYGLSGIRDAGAVRHARPLASACEGGADLSRKPCAGRSPGWSA